MRKLGLITTAGIIGLVAAMPAANAQDIFRGAQQGAYEGSREGNRVAGPVGGLVGGAVGTGVGAAVGGVNGVLGIAPNRAYHKKYRSNRTVRQSDRVYYR